MPSSALTLSPKWTGASQRIALHKIAVKMVRGIVNNRRDQRSLEVGATDDGTDEETGGSKGEADPGGGGAVSPIHRLQ